MLAPPLSRGESEPYLFLSWNKHFKVRVIQILDYLDYAGQMPYHNRIRKFYRLG